MKREKKVIKAVIYLHFLEKKTTLNTNQETTVIISFTFPQQQPKYSPKQYQEKIESM